MDCDVNCDTCVNFIFGLDQHIRAAHSQQATTDMTDDTDFTNGEDGEIVADDEGEELRLNLLTKMDETLIDSKDDLDPHTKPNLSCSNHFPRSQRQRVPDLQARRKKPFICGFCLKEYNVQKMLNVHVKKLHTNSHKLKYVCGICEERFLNKIRLNHHIIKTHKKNERKKLVPTCEDCGMSFTTVRKLGKHIRAVHGREPPGTENKNVNGGLGGAGKKSKKKKKKGEELMSNLPIASDENVTLTDSQEKPKLKAKRKYKKKAGQSQNNPPEFVPIVAKMFYHCEFCPEKFETQGMLSDHSRRHHTNLTSASAVEEMPYVCEFCPKRFKAQKTLNYHVNRYHKISDKKTFVCVICDERFLDQSRVNRHVLKKHPNDRKMLLPTCKECGMSFAKETRLENHMKGCPDWKRRFECSTCRRKFVTSESLFQHLKNQHRDIGQGENQKHNIDVGVGEPKKIKLEKL